MEKKLPDRRLFPLGSVVALFIGILLIQQFILPLFARSTELSYSEFKTDLTAGKVASVTVGSDRLTGKLSDGSAFYTLLVPDQDLTKELEAQKVNIRGEAASSG